MKPSTRRCAPIARSTSCCRRRSVARRRPRQRSSSTLGWSGFGGVLLLLLAIGAGGILAYFYFAAPERPVLDPQTLCPVDGPQGIYVVVGGPAGGTPGPAPRA